MDIKRIYHPTEAERVAQDGLVEMPRQINRARMLENACRIYDQIVFVPAQFALGRLPFVAVR